MRINHILKSVQPVDVEFVILLCWGARAHWALHHTCAHPASITNLLHKIEHRVQPAREPARQFLSACKQPTHTDLRRGLKLMADALDRSCLSCIQCEAHTDWELLLPCCDLGWYGTHRTSLEARAFITSEFTEHARWRWRQSMQLDLPQSSLGVVIDECIYIVLYMKQPHTNRPFQSLRVMPCWNPPIALCCH